MMKILEKKVHCLRCRGLTNHDVLFEQTDFDDEGEPWLYEECRYQVIKCRGCDRTSFREERSINGSHPLETLYPPERKHSRTAIVESWDFPSKVVGIYDETLRAFNALALTLTAIGLRALAEAICLDQGCQGKDLQERIEALVSSGLLSRSQGEFLHLQRYLGNAAAHEIEPPPLEDVMVALDILESLLRTIYHLSDQARRLQNKHEQRRKQRPAQQP